MDVRKYRAINEKLYLLSSHNNEDCLLYNVTGSTGNVYSVKVSSMSSCTCPDFIKRHNKCKHIYFVLLKVLKLEDDNKQFYSEEEFKEIKDKFKDFSVYDSNVKADESIINKWKLFSKKDVDDVCPICLDDLQNGEELDYCKAVCGKYVHKECFKLWSRSKNSVCVFCKSKWVEIDDYVNLY